MRDIQLNDPLRNKITLTQKCWMNHILAKHPIMRNFLKETTETIRNPDYIFQSKISEASQLYFKHFEESKGEEFYLMIVVERKTHSSRGFVKTGFPVYHLSKGGQLIWKKG